MRAPRALCLIVSGLLLASPSSAQLCSPCADRGSIRIAGIPHGSTTDGFWLQVKRGADAAGEKLGVALSYDLFETEDHAAQAARIREVAQSGSFHAILTTIPSSVVSTAISEMSSTIPIFTLNSGYDIYEGLGSLTHIGMHEMNGGSFALANGFEVKRPSNFNIQRCVYVTYFTGGANQARRRGFKESCEAAGLELVETADFCSGDDGCVLPAPSDVSASAGKIGELFSQMETDGKMSGVALLLGGGTSVAPAMEWYAATSNAASTVMVGVFDTSDDIFSYIGTGELAFGVSQNQWLQGYLPVVLATLYVQTGQLMGAPTVMMTGPDFITSAPTDAYTALSGEAFPICSSSSCNTQPIGDCPISSCSAPCLRMNDVKIRGICHGHEQDTFWYVVKAGAEQAALDFGLDDFEMDLYTPPFSVETMAADITQAANDQDLDGLFVSIPSSTVESAVTTAVSAGKKVVSINSGGDVSQGLGTLAHVGMSEFVAGREAARQLATLGATKILCPVHELSNSALEAPCDGAADYDSNVEIVKVNMVDAGVDTSSTSAVDTFIKGQLDSDTTLNGILFVGVGITERIIDSELLEGYASRLLWAGSFDNSGLLQDAIAEKDTSRIYFGIDQQQYLQGYFAVMYLVLNILTDLRLAGHLIGSGPFYVMEREASKAMCLSMSWPYNLPEKDWQYTVGFPACPMAETNCETCGNVRDAYRTSGCCGNPNAPFIMEGSRRLSSKGVRRLNSLESFNPNQLVNHVRDTKKKFGKIAAEKMSSALKELMDQAVNN